MLRKKGVEARLSGITKMKMLGGKLERIYMLCTIPES